MILYEHRELAEIRQKFLEKTIVFCSGVFDLTHVGHVVFLENCKNLGDILVVGVGSDESVRFYKGGARPILSERIRIKMIDSLKCVDFSFFSSPPNLNDPFSDLPRIFEKLRPNIYAINDDVSNMEKREEMAEKFKMKLTVFKKNLENEFANISTTSIIQKTKNSG